MTTLPTLKEQIAGRCKSFTGVQNEVCKAGVRYADVRGEAFPCLRRPNRPEPPECPARVFPSAEEVDAEEAELRASFDQHLAKIGRGECPTCGEDLEPRRQVGRCIYGACGHRIGQGQL